MKTILLLFILLVPTLAFSQKSDTSYVENYIYQHSKGSFSYSTDANGIPTMTQNSTNYFVVNDVEYKIDFFGNNLRPFVADNPDAVAELDKMKAKATTAIVGGGITILGLGIALANGPTEPTGETVFDPRTGKRENKEKITPGGALGMGIMGLGVVIALVSGPGSGKHAHRAIDIYNKDLMASKSTSFTLAPVFQTNQVGLGIRLSF